MGDFRLRIPDDLHKRLAELAVENNRSMNSEIIKRLVESLDFDKYDIPQMDENIGILWKKMESMEREIYELQRSVHPRIDPYDD